MESDNRHYEEDRRRDAASAVDREREANTKSRQSKHSLRYYSLSKPRVYHYKQTKWVNDKGAVAKWGTQQMLTPPSVAAKSAVASPRVEQLAQSKSDKQENISRHQYYYSCGRDSQISLVDDGAKTAALSARVEQLAQPKEAPKEFTDKPYREQYWYSCGRQSPVWPVDERAKTAEERPRTNTLAKHKEYHREYLAERPLPNQVPPTARKASCSERLDSLAKAKDRSDNQFRDALWEVPQNARKATATPRTLELARYKPTYEGYHFNFDYGAGSEKLPRLIRVVTRNARNAVPSSRTKELSVPIIRQSMDLVQFNPQAFIISPTALKAYCPPRINELAQPLVR